MGFAYFPELYPDELFYSWICRYYAHSGFPNYNMVLEEILQSRTARIDMEFLGKLNADAKQFFEQNYGMEKLIWEHSMLPQYVKFIPQEQLMKAIDVLKIGGDDIHNVVPIPTRTEDDRFLRYCPCCTNDDRKIYGEAYFHREHQLRWVNICPKHKCRLRKTDIEMAAQKSPRLWIAEEVIPDTEDEPLGIISAKEIELGKYITDVFRSPTSRSEVTISQYLASKLEGTKYLSRRGKQKKMRLLFEDLMDYYRELQILVPITKRHQLEKIYTGSNTNLAAICMLGYFLGIPSDELVNPVLPEVSVTEDFDAEIKRLSDQVLGCYRIAKELGCSPSTIVKARKPRQEKDHDYGVRKGMEKQNWTEMDDSMVETVRKICENIYSGTEDKGRPHRVTINAVVRKMGWPGKRMEYLPKCKQVISQYFEKQEEYWAREIVWAYTKLDDEKTGETIQWVDIRRLTNLRKENVRAALPFLERDRLEMKEAVQDLL